MTSRILPKGEVHQPGECVYQTTGRLEASDFRLFPVPSDHAKGLEMLTDAIYNSAEIKFTTPRKLSAIFKDYTGQHLDSYHRLSTAQLNKRLAALVRDTWTTCGWVAGYGTLFAAASSLCPIHRQIIFDISTAFQVHTLLAKGCKSLRAINLSILITTKDNGSIFRVGPKSRGGDAWKACKLYKSILARLIEPNDGVPANFSPCVAYGFLASIQKVVPTALVAKVTKLQLLQTVSYDLDRINANFETFQYGFTTTINTVLTSHSALKKLAMASMFSFDFQTRARRIQEERIGGKEERGAPEIAPLVISPQDWVSMKFGSCGTITSFAFDTTEGFNSSRAATIAGMILLDCYDLLFDTGCSNQTNSVQYVKQAGASIHGIPAAFGIGFTEMVARHFLASYGTYGHNERPLYGYLTAMVMSAWAPFNTRYRTWERCVKYQRQLRRDPNYGASIILGLAHEDLVLENCDLNADIGASWKKAISSTDLDLELRKTDAYFISARSAELLMTAGVKPPVLCHKDRPNFEKTMNDTEYEEVHAIKGLPEFIIKCQAAGLAVAIRRAVIWASTECCDSCASKIGIWADAAAYSVLTCLLHEEPKWDTSTWALQNYFVGTVALWPVSLPFLLSGFDLEASIVCGEGAMDRWDVVHQVD